MFESKFTLRQETPIIHFLYDQPQATLRATELKPKLDKFLVSRIGVSALNNDWIIKTDDKGHISLDYKVSIRPIGRNHVVQLEIEEKYDRETKKTKWETKPTYPHLLANMGGKEHKEELKNLVLYDGAEISIKTWHEDILQLIKTHLPQLLADTNFGNRSGKGFGSFTCTEVDGVAQRTKPSMRYCFDWRPNGSNVKDQQKSLFDAINWFYKCLRSGINQVNRNGTTEFYFKSIMFAYAQNHGEKWDKYTIKNHFFTGGELPETKVDYRDWLGLSTEEKWGRQHKITKEGTQGVERFASPVFFKPVRSGNQYKIYFGVSVAQEVLTKFSQATINVHLDGKQNLELQPTDKLKIDEFLRFALEETNIEEHLFAFDRDDINRTDYWLYRDFIRPIFSSIRKNLQ